MTLQYTVTAENDGHMSELRTYMLSTAIGLWKHRIPSDLRS